jgi:transcriptional regulator with GAF, ATPase, and Fis domain
MAVQLAELHQLYQTAPIGLCLVDRNLRLIRINERLAAVNGKPAAEHIGRTMREVIPTIAGQVEPIYRKVIATGEPVLDVEIHGAPLPEPTKQCYWLTHYHPLKVSDGTVLGVNTIVQEITEAGCCEEALRKSEELNRAILTSLKDHIAVLDKDGTIIAVNEAWNRFGHENDVTSLASISAGVNYLDICRQASRESDETARQALAGIQSVLDGSQEAFVIEYPCPSPSESRWFTMYVTSLEGYGGGAVVSHLDLTAYKRMEDMLKERLRFETLLSELSATFVNVPASEVETHIVHGLRRVVEFLGIERSNLLTFSDNQMQLNVLHSCAVEGYEPLTAVIMDHQFPWYTAKLRGGEAVVVESLDDLPEEAMREKAHSVKAGVKATLIIPLTVAGRLLGAIGFVALRTARTWPETLVGRLQLVGQIFANALMHKRVDDKLHHAYEEIMQLKDQLQTENLYLRQEVDLINRHVDIIGQSDAIRQVLSQIEHVADTKATVLLVGETGTGKELLARAVHNLSRRKQRPLIKVNCAALPSTLIESELFGREKGAYTGALSKQIGRFDMADGSTLFLDEIGELPLDLQAKLLRVLEDGQFERLGSPKTVTVDVRIVAATNQALAQAVREGRFREDLYYRLNVFPIAVPPLRARQEDIPALVWSFVRDFGERMGKQIETIPRQSMEALQRYAWPGNVRELRNVIERAMIITKGSTLRILLPQIPDAGIGPDRTLAAVERQHILEVLEETGWRIRGNHGAADTLGLKPTTLEARMLRLGIQRPK